MPRPGPRPYECVRRAWHSDRHQPMRGSIIQQIFRVVKESHTSATKKNKEWQEKLPIVVLKAEEIMYSKANSEAEYIDHETLWDRVNEAINTIIKRDESTETGELLPPCVEAALNLGCVPVRASRSQRNSNPRSYLNPRTQESGCIPPKILDNTTDERNPTLLPLQSANQSTVAASNFTLSVSESNRDAMQKNKNIPMTSCNFPLSHEKLHSPRNNRFISMETNTTVNMGCVYPLYFGTHFHPEVSQLGIQSTSNTIIDGTPIIPSIAEPAEMGCLQNVFSCDRDENASNRITKADFRDNHEKAPEQAECDLSLRLGLFSDPCMSRRKASAHDPNNVGPCSSQEGAKFSGLFPPPNKEFSFFPVESANEAFNFSTSKWNFEGEGQSVQSVDRKRKVPSSNNVEDGQFFWQPDPTSNQFTGQMKRPGL